MRFVLHKHSFKKAEGPKGEKHDPMEPATPHSTTPIGPIDDEDEQMMKCCDCVPTKLMHRNNKLSATALISAIPTAV
jgi:hypothetical protein